MKVEEGMVWKGRLGRSFILFRGSRYWVEIGVLRGGKIEGVLDVI